jgi:hypothetical protein
MGHNKNLLTWGQMGPAASTSLHLQWEEGAAAAQVWWALAAAWGAEPGESQRQQ